MNRTNVIHLSYQAKNDCSPYEIHLQKGHYLFELWGASGGGNNGGKGAYVAGLITFFTKTVLYAYIGTKGENTDKKATSKKGGCNGGGSGGKSTSSSYYSGSGGGGATDIRLSPSFDAYTDSLIVAGGGGGSCGVDIAHGFGGDAGIYEGYDSTGYKISLGGGKETCMNFGYGMNGRDGTALSAGGEGVWGGGGGYFGGCAYQVQGANTNSGGGGGSSYVSGYPNMERHKSFFFSFFNIQDGKQIFLSPDGKSEKGHLGDGFLRISYMPNMQTFMKNPLHSSCFYYFMILILK